MRCGNEQISLSFRCSVLGRDKVDGARFPDQLHKVDAGAALSQLGVSRELLRGFDLVETYWKMK